MKPLPIAVILALASVLYQPTFATAAEAPPHVAATQVSFQEGESESEPKDVPWIPILALSIAIPAAFLAASSFLGKRGGGH